ncbi:TonB-dependent receptor [bacterium]|nr:TonB-dependent receptor [bacterium]
MKQKYKETYFKTVFWVCIILQVILYAESKQEKAAFGQLKGKLIDQSTRQPLISADIIIEGSNLGAATDTSGQYVIMNVPSGIYNVRFMMMGYESRIVNQVIVNPGRTTWQQIEMKTTIIEGQGVTVTAGYFPSARDAIVSSRSVDFQEIQSDPGSAEDIQRVMQALPAVVSSGDGSNEIIVRGGMPGENLFLMDDIEIPNPNHFADQGTSGGPINMIDSKFVRKIDFYAGAFPARYGDKASSVMDISLREGDREQFTGHAYMSMAGAGLSAEGPLFNGKGSYLISGRRSYIDLILSNIGMEEVPHYYSFQTKWVYDIGKNNKLILNTLYGSDDIEGDDGDNPDNVSDDYYIWKFNSGQQVYGLGWRCLLGKTGYLKTLLSQVKAEWDIWETKNELPNYKNRSMETERTLKSELVILPSSRAELQLGIQVKDVHFNITQWMQGDTLFVHELDPSGAILSKEIHHEYDSFSQQKHDNDYKAAAYFHGKWHPSSKWTISAGLRGDYFHFIGDGAIDPRLGLSYHVTPVTSVNLAVGQQSQTPGYAEITAHPLNTDLDYKRTRQVVFGMAHLFREDIRGTVELFYKGYDKVPIGTAELTPDPFDVSSGRGVSKGEGFAKGIELFLQKKPTGSTHFTVSYAYSISKGKDPRNGHYFNWDYDYRHVLTAIGGIQLHLKDKKWYQKLEKTLIYKFTGWLLPFGDEVEISCRWRYLGGRPYTRPNYHQEYQTWLLDENVTVNAHRLPAYHRLDLRLDRRFMFKGWNIVTYLDIMNIYNQKNIWMYNYKSNGGVETYNQFSFLPVVGITVEF